MASPSRLVLEAKQRRRNPSPPVPNAAPGAMPTRASSTSLHGELIGIRFAVHLEHQIEGGIGAGHLHPLHAAQALGHQIAAGAKSRDLLGHERLALLDGRNRRALQEGLAAAGVEFQQALDDRDKPAGITIQPSRQPVMAQVLEKLLTAMTGSSGRANCRTEGATGRS